MSQNLELISIFFVFQSLSSTVWDTESTLWFSDAKSVLLVPEVFFFFWDYRWCRPWIMEQIGHQFDQ